MRIQKNKHFKAQHCMGAATLPEACLRIPFLNLQYPAGHY